MEVSVVIPTHRRPARIAACVGALGVEAAAGEIATEVLVGCDGPDPHTEAMIRGAWGRSGAPPSALHVEQSPKVGQAGVRNALLARARGATVLFLNDDMVPGPGLIAAHARAQRENTRAMVVGSAPWMPRTPDTMMARLLRETSMVFFYNVMDRAPRDPARDWGFRHAWMLNLSAPLALIRAVGGLSIFPSSYGYEDDELAFRLATRMGVRVLYRPEAKALHDHPMNAEEYLGREYNLGYAAWGFAAAAPECALAMFRRDLRGDEEESYARLFTARELAMAKVLRVRFGGLDHLSPDGPPSLVETLYEHHLPLKRWMWRRGLLAAAQGGAMDADEALRDLEPTQS